MKFSQTLKKAAKIDTAQELETWIYQYSIKRQIALKAKLDKKN
jgi:hypothetical protein